MSAFARRVAELTRLAPERIERLAGGDLSGALLLHHPDGRLQIAKGGLPGAEAAMLRSLANAGVPAPLVEGEHEDVLLLDHVANDGVFSPRAWADVGTCLRRLHDTRGERFGWPADYRIGTVDIDNRESEDWPSFWGERRLVATARVLDRPWRERVERAAALMPELLPSRPAASLLHGDLWTGNILVNGGRVAAFIDPACYYGHSEADLAMLTLFADPPNEFQSAYGALDEGWDRRRPAYQLFPALLHMRLFGASYESLADNLLSRLDA
jgi:fructosamine-3-kinase